MRWVAADKADLVGSQGRWRARRARAVTVAKADIDKPEVSSNSSGIGRTSQGPGNTSTAGSWCQNPCKVSAGAEIGPQNPGWTSQDPGVGGEHGGLSS